MSIFSRLRKRDTENTPAATPGTAPKTDPVSLPADAPTAVRTTASEAKAPAREAPRKKTGPVGTTRAYHAVKAPTASTPRHAVPISIPGAIKKGPSNPSVEARGTVSAPGTAPKATNAANGVLGGTGAVDQGAEATSPIGPLDPAVEATFEDVSIAHTAPIRGFMLEVRWGEAQASWIELARPALRSLRRMAEQMDHGALPAAVDVFDSALGELLQVGRHPAITEQARDALLAAYAPLVAALPRAFDLDGERDRREPLIVRALLEQVPGLDPLMFDRMVVAGLGRLEALTRAKAEEIADVAGLPAPIAAGVAEVVRAFRRETPAALAAPEGAAAALELRRRLDELADDHRAFETAADGWSAADREAKKRTRRRRDVAFCRVTIALARLGEVDLALRLSKLPFGRRLEELEGLVARLTVAAPPPDEASERDTPSYDEIQMDERMESGAHAAP